MGIAGNQKPIPEPAEALIAKRASAQHGVFSRAQALDAGIGYGTIQRRLITGRWETLHPGVYRVAGTPGTWRQKLLAACLAWGEGTVVSHRAAAALWRLLGFETGPIELTVRRGRKRTLPGIVHRPRSLPTADATILDGIPVTTVERTLLDIAAIADPEAVEEALDDALRRGLVSKVRLQWRFARTANHGRSGTHVLQLLLQARSGGPSIRQSRFETKVLRAIKEAGLPAPAIQHQIRDGSRVVAVVDFAYPDHRVAIEADGYRWHSGRLRFERDLARRNRLTSLGWRVVHVTWTDMTRHPESVIRSIREALAHAER